MYICMLYMYMLYILYIYVYITAARVGAAGEPPGGGV